MSVLVLPVLSASGEAVAGTCPGVTFEQNTSQDGTGEWITGALNAQNSSYAEGDFVPQRAVLSDVSAGTHTFVFTYDTARDEKYAYDYVARWSIEGGSITTWADDNPYSPATADGPPRGAPTGVHKPVATVTVTFEATAPVVTFNFAGHLASAADHGAGAGASSISGAPFHISLSNMDECELGQRDNQIQPGAVLPPGLGRVTAKKLDDATGEPITAPATFQLWNDVNDNEALDPNDTKVGDPQSTSNGSVTWTDLAYGNYLVEETVAPDGYTLPDPAYKAVTVDESNDFACLTFRDVKAPEKAAVTVKKLWRINGQSMWQGDQPSGFSAQLTLTGPGAAGATDQEWGKPRGAYAIGDEVTIDESATVPQQCTLRRWLFWENGKWVAKPLPYTAKLAQADNVYKVKNEVTCKTNLTVSKVDDATGKAIDTATFQLWNDVNANKNLDPADTTVGTTKSTSNGTATWTDLAYGNYLVEETAAPADYTLPSPSYQPVTGDKNHLWPTLTFRDAKKSVPPSGSITVHKHAGTTDGPLLDTAKFQLWNDVNGNAALDQTDAKVGTEKSTSDGVATWTGLPYGKYLVQETVAPAGYTLPSPAYQAVTVNGTATLQFVDQPKVTPPPVTPQIDLQVRKHAGTTDGPLLDTAKFQLWNDVNANATLDPADTKAGTEKSTSNGTATWSDLAPGAYLVEETVAPTGYTRPDPAYRAVTLTAAQDGTTVVLDFADQLAPVPVQTVNLQVLKHAGSTAGRLIDTATFQLWNDVNGNGVLNPTVDTKAGSTVATSGGAYTWTGLATGTYLVQEVSAPEGYKLASPRYQAVTLAAADLGTTVTVDFADAEIAGVEVVRPPAEVTPGAAPAVSGPSYGGVQTLPQTGARERNQLLGLLGTAFVAFGGGLLLSSRRRNVQR